MFTKKNQTSLRDSIQQQGQALDENWARLRGAPALDNDGRDHTLDLKES